MKILVIGDSCTDIFKYGKCTRLCPEAPVPIFTPVSSIENKGMAGNVAANLESLGAEVDLVTNKENIQKIRYVDDRSNHLLMREDIGDKVPNSFSIKEIDFSKYDAVVVSDYCKGFLSESDILEIGECHNMLFLDTKKVLNHTYMNGYSFIKINEQEWNQSKSYGATLSEWNKKLIVTLSEQGCMYDGDIYPASDNQSVRDISGAGDTFLAALAFEYIKTRDIIQSIIFANYCAGQVVKKKGVSVI